MAEEMNVIEKPSDGADVNEMSELAARHEIPRIRHMVHGVDFDPRTQYVSPDGNTVYNLPDSHPAVEAVKGEKKYRVKETIDEEKVKQAGEIDQLRNKVDSLIAALAGKALGEQTVVPAAAPAPSKMDYDTLYGIAKRINPKLKGRPAEAKLRAIVFGETEGNDSAATEDSE